MQKHELCILEKLDLSACEEAQTITLIHWPKLTAVCSLHTLSRWDTVNQLSHVALSLCTITIAYREYHGNAHLSGAISDPLKDAGISEFLFICAQAEWNYPTVARRESIHLCRRPEVSVSVTCRRLSNSECREVLVTALTSRLGRSGIAFWSCSFR